MKLYADRPRRWLIQVIADVSAFALALLAIWIATEAHEQVLRLRAPGDRLVDAGTSLQDTFNSAADSADGVPLVGDALAGALHKGSDAALKLNDAGRWQIDAVEDLALWLAIALVAIPLLFLITTWLPLRLRFVRQATAAVRLRELGDGGLDLLALRALATQPLTRLAKAGDLTTSWRDRDPDAIARLAKWELKRLGLTTRPHARRTGSSPRLFRSNSWRS